MIPSRTTMSKEDILALIIIKEFICLKEGHYEMALPRRDDVPCLPGN